MILPPLAEDYNENFPSIAHPYFDDHQVRREHHSPATFEATCTSHIRWWTCHPVVLPPVPKALV